MKKVLIIGAGKIGKHLWHRLLAGSHDVSFIHRNTAGDPRSEIARTKPDAVFLAISTLDNGEAALSYITTCLKLGIPVITCEKGALAYHADKLIPHLDQIGWSATVGGGTMLGPYLRGRNPRNQKVAISAVLNATLNFIFDEVRRGGRTLGEACVEAMRLGYAEPGSNGPLDLIHGEIEDVERKACVLFNTCIAKDMFMKPEGFIKFNQESLEKMSGNAANYRMLVHLSNYPVESTMLFEGAFGIEIDGWNISGGFEILDGNHERFSWLPGGVGNAIQIVEGDLGAGGKFRLEGPGAGAEATTGAMLNDFERLMETHTRN